MSDPPSPTRWPAWKRVPPFLPVPLRARADGWTPDRQARFIGLLAETGSVGAAARGVGMSRESAWRLRRRTGAGSFAHAWNTVIALRQGKAHGDVDFPKRKITPDELAERALDGEFHILMPPAAVRPHAAQTQHYGAFAPPPAARRGRGAGRMGVAMSGSGANPLYPGFRVDFAGLGRRLFVPSPPPSTDPG